MVKNYIIIALRNLWKNRTISYINVFGLAVSMSVCLMLILIVADQLSYDSYHTNKDSIYRVITDRYKPGAELWSTATTAYPLSDVLSTHGSIEKMTVIKNGFSGITTWKEQEIPFEGLYTTPSFFKIFDFPLEHGNMSTALSVPNSIVVKKGLAEKIFGTGDAINEIVSVEGKGDFIVTGVLSELPGKTHITFDALTSVDFLSGLEKRDSTFSAGFNDWYNIYNTYIYFQLKAGASPADLTPLLDQASVDHYKSDETFSCKFLIQSLKDITPGPLLSNMLGFGLPMFVIYILLAIALIVLLSACFNYANLTTARAMNRVKEIGIRKVVGASRKHIFGQFIIEAVLIAVVAFIFSDLMVQFIEPMMNGFFKSTGAPVTFDQTPYLYLWFLGFMIITGLLAGLIPALFLSATNPLNAIKKTIRLANYSNKLGFRKFDVRKLLVVVQFAFSVFFVITVITLYRQSTFVLNADHGFRTEGIVNIRLQGLDYSDLQQSMDRLSSIQMMASATPLPALGSNNTTNARHPGQEGAITLSYIGVDENYIPSMELNVLAGKNFPEIMPASERYVILNEKAMARFGWDTPVDAIGKSFEINETQVEVLGVIEDFHYERLDEPIGPMALRYRPQKANNAIVLIDGGNAKVTIAELDAAWKELTNRPFEYTYYEDDLRLSYAHFEALAIVLGYVTIVVMSIACLGLLGMVIYHIQNRTKEIGIRKALGAEILDVLLIVGRGFLVLITVAYAIGAPLAYFVNDMWLTTNARRIEFGLPTLIQGLVLVLLIVLVTVGSQIYKALKINPVESLQSE